MSNDLEPVSESKAEVVLSLADKTKRLLNIKEQLSELESLVKELKEQKQIISTDILNDLKKREEFSVRLKEATVTLSVKKTAAVVDQRAVVENLKARGLTDYVDEQVNDLFKDKVLKEIAKSGETLPGVVIRETEYITVKASTKDERRQVVTEDYKKLN